MQSDSAFVISPRYVGPPGYAHGGYVGGLAARHIDGPAEVTLRRPVPIGRPLTLERREDGTVLLRFEGALVLEAHPTAFELAVPPAPSPAEAERASTSYLGFRKRLPFSHCFGCGPDRPEGEGLRIFPGLLGDGLLAAPWMPESSLADGTGRVRPEFVWAALDCPGGFAVMGESLRTLLTGRFAVRIDESPRAGEPCVIAAWPMGRDGRKHFAGSALYGESGRLLAAAKATWIETIDL